MGYAGSARTGSAIDTGGLRGLFIAAKARYAAGRRGVGGTRLQAGMRRVFKLYTLVTHVIPFRRAL